MSSTLHLGNPQRAWRALSQWRSSWLSREGVMAITSFAPLICSAIAAWWAGRFIWFSGLTGAGLALVTVYCTAMIYASLKSVQAWHTPLTVACYLLFSASGGLLTGAAIAAAGGSEHFRLLLALTFVSLVAAWIAKILWWRRLAALTPLSTPETATGLGFIGRVRLLERPHVNENYLTREMGFRVARKHAEKLALIALAAGGFVPALVVVGLLVAGALAGWPAALLLCVTALCHLAGVMVERWLFFAQAKHAVMNYYGG